MHYNNINNLNKQTFGVGYPSAEQFSKTTSPTLTTTSVISSSSSTKILHRCS